AREPVRAQRIERVAYRVFVIGDHRVTIGFLVARQHQRVERKRVIFRSRAFLLDQRRQDAYFRLIQGIHGEQRRTETSQKSKAFPALTLRVISSREACPENGTKTARLRHSIAPPPMSLARRSLLAAPAARGPAPRRRTGGRRKRKSPTTAGSGHDPRQTEARPMRRNSPPAS